MLRLAQILRSGRMRMVDAGDAPASRYSWHRNFSQGDFSG
jgi:hypothetical protein